MPTLSLSGLFARISGSWVTASAAEIEAGCTQHGYCLVLINVEVNEKERKTYYKLYYLVIARDDSYEYVQKDKAAAS